MYWTVLSLGPLVMVIVRYFGDKASNAFAGMPGLTQLFKFIGWAGPVLTGIILLAALYKVMPNTRVQFKAAIGGALVVVPLWLGAKWLFGLYVMDVASGSLYGALGVIPLFLMWVNLSWTIFLFGAEVSHTAANLRRLRAEDLARRLMLGPTDMLAATLAVAEPFMAGKGPVTFEEIAGSIDLPDESIHKLLGRLEQIGIVSPVGTEGHESYVPTRPPDGISILEVMEITSGEQPSRRTHYRESLARRIEMVRRQVNKAIGRLTIADVVTAGNTGDAEDTGSKENAGGTGDAGSAGGTGDTENT